MRRQWSYPAVLAIVLTAMPGQAAEWSEEVPVRAGTQTVLRFRARIAGDFLVVQALHEPGWHSYAMGNDLRVEERLAGKPSLGIEQGIRVEVESGGTTHGPWYQSPPHDLSQAELLHFTWGFDGTATFAQRLECSGADPVVLQIDGQTCNDQTCWIIDIELTVPPPQGGQEAEFSMDQLVLVRTKDGADPRAPTSQEDSLR